MPVPEPRTGEDEQEFISRCIRTMKHTDPERADDQIQAICYSQWREDLEWLVRKDARRFMK